MSTTLSWRSNVVLRVLASLWLAAVVLVLLLFALACATVYESVHGAEHALLVFYRTSWFQALLWLLAVNVLLAVVVRWPISRRQLGFLVTHTSILLILLGALVTQRFAVEGQVSLLEGESAREFATPQEVLTLRNTENPQHHVVVDLPSSSAATLDSVRVEVARFLPDAVAVERVVNDNPAPRTALELSLSADTGTPPQWVLEDQTVDFGGLALEVKSVADVAAFQTAVATDRSTAPGAKGVLQWEFSGVRASLPIESLMERPLTIGDGSYTLQVLRYLPHATVGPEKKLVNASDRALNPAVEVEIVGPEAREQRVAFARFPDFRSMHGATQSENVRLTFIAPEEASPTPVTVHVDASGKMLARFQSASAAAMTQELVMGTPISTPWEGKKLTVHRRFDRARQERTYEPAPAPGESRMPALQVRVSDPTSQTEIWLEKHRPRPVTVQGAAYELAFMEKTLPLGFGVTLNKFAVGYYPGERRPRSFESTLSITDPQTGRTLSRVVSMNHPTTFSGYTLFQSSYKQDGKRSMSVLSVSRDPGQPIVFTGYILLLVGMVWVLFTRLGVFPTVAESAASNGTKRGQQPGRIDLLRGDERCRTNAPDANHVGNGRHSRPTPATTTRVRSTSVEHGLMVALICGWACAAQAGSPTLALDPAPLRDLVVQHDGRWPPLDTVARDVVESVTGSASFQGQDPVVTLLAWTFDAKTGRAQPLIKIGNVELRAAIGLPPTQTVFSFDELVRHSGFRALVMQLEQRNSGKKLDPLESKVSGIHEKLTLLQRVFDGGILRPVPNAADPLGAWRPLEAVPKGESSALDQAKSRWDELRAAFLAADPDGFALAATNVRQALAALPAAYRPDPSRVARELQYNRLDPFRRAWQILLAGTILLIASMPIRRRWFDALARVVLFTGLATLSYGLGTRWSIAGRVPASNMYESLLFLSWGGAVFTVVSSFFFRDRLVPLTAAGIGTLALFLADVLPMDSYIRPIAPVLLDTAWMAIHVPTIMVSYAVLALAVLIAHIQLVVLAFAPARVEWTERADRLHHIYVQVGVILLAAGIMTGSMWAASSWGRYWGWDPKEVWSLVALLGYLTILHVRVDRERVPMWALAVGAVLLAALFVIVVPRLAPITSGKLIALVAAGLTMIFMVTAKSVWTTAVKSIVCFWLIIMTYVGVNYILGAGLHSYGFGSGAAARSMFTCGISDLALVAVCCGVIGLRSRSRQQRSLHPEIAWSM